MVLFELHIPHARGLKEKRKVVKSLIERLHQKHRVSVAEVGLHELHQRAEVAIALASSSAKQAEHLLDNLRSTVEIETLGCQLTQWNAEILDLD